MQDAEEYCIEDELTEDEKKSRPIIKNAMDLQRLKLEKLMSNPDKPVIIPEQPKEKDFMQTVPTFVRNVMGSSAGAGSGEFHVYRHLRRKEYARQKYIQAKSIREQMDDEYRQKLEQNRLDAEEKTAKRRAKRLKKKQKLKQKGKRRKEENTPEQNDVLSESSELSEPEASTEGTRSTEDENIAPEASTEGIKSTEVESIAPEASTEGNKSTEVESIAPENKEATENTCSTSVSEAKLDTLSEDKAECPDNEATSTANTTDNGNKCEDEIVERDKSQIT